MWSTKLFSLPVFRGIGVFMRQILSEDDNITFDLAKVMALIAFCSYLAMSVWHLIHTGTFQHVDFANGMMSVLLGAGGVIAGKQLTGGRRADDGTNSSLS